MTRYRRHSPMTDPGPLLPTDVPADLSAMVDVIGGVLVHRDETAWRFGFALPEHRREEANTRHVAAILDRLGSLAARPPQERFAGTCRDFTVLLVAMLRAAGVAARARCGFAGYFVDGFFDDHWVAEVWSDDRGWRLVDAQVGSAPKGTYRGDVDPFDVPRDAFLVAGHAWLDCRAGRRDPETVGTSAAGLTGMWEIQGSVVRDLANLTGIETLPWDAWGLIPVHYRDLAPADLELLDRAAEVSRAGGPPERADEVYASDPRLAVPTPMSSAPAAG